MVSLVRAGFGEMLDFITIPRPKMVQLESTKRFELLETELEMCFTLCVYNWEKRESQQLKTLPTSIMGISTRFDIFLKVSPKVEVKKRSNLTWYEMTNSFWIQIQYKTIYNRLKPVWYGLGHYLNNQKYIAFVT